MLELTVEISFIVFKNTVTDVKSNRGEKLTQKLKGSGTNGTDIRTSLLAAMS